MVRNIDGPHVLMIINETDFRWKTFKIHNVFDYHSDSFVIDFYFEHYDRIACYIAASRLNYNSKEFCEFNGTVWDVFEKG